MVTYKELEEKSMTPEKRAMANIDLGGFYVGRPISYWVTLPFLEKGVSATLVSALSAVFAIAALVVFLLSQSIVGFVIAWVLIFIWNILDGVDGNIARYTDTASPMGGLWDASVGWLATVVWYMGMGLAAWRLPGILNIDWLEPYWFAIGCCTSMCWIFPRLVMHKKIGLCGKKSAADVQERTSYGLAKIVFFNVTSINGIGAVIFLVCVFAHLSDVCMLFYFVISLAMAVASCCNLLEIKDIR